MRSLLLQCMRTRNGGQLVIESIRQQRLQCWQLFVGLRAVYGGKVSERDEIVGHAMGIEVEDMPFAFIYSNIWLLHCTVKILKAVGEV